MEKKNIDLILGKKTEKEILPIIRDYFNCNVVMDEDNEFDTIDFKDEFTLIELKCRRINHNQYSTCLIGLNKYRYFRENKDKKCYIVYKYNDGLFYIRVKRKYFKNFETKIQNTWRDGKCESSEVILIPIEYLKKIDV